VKDFKVSIRALEGLRGANIARQGARRGVDGGLEGVNQG
jgi:hypothetical protein